jgi:signal transduction histidine kinase
MTLEPHDAGDACRRRADEHWNRRRDLERQLHDGPALRIAALTLHLGLLAQKARDGTGELAHDIEDLQGQLHIVLQELRAIADQIYPPLLQEAGLGPALRELASSVQAPVRVDAVDGRFDAAVEGAAYFAVLEVLEDLRVATRTVDITVRRDDDGLALDLANVDTGQGIAVGDRIHRLGGAVEIVGDSTIKVRIPCE